ncbi:MAG: hypothetical protein D4R69_02215 [Actinomycetales bacterium]|nr:MAG: hypothetical protein D4R69_02215 [Actinomycetales bacterium]
MGIYQMVFLGGTPLTSPLIGWSSEHFGIRHTIAACALMTMIPIILIWMRCREGIEVPSDISVSAVLEADPDLPPK